MALWDLYLAGESWWARQTGWSVYGMIREKQLAKQCHGRLTKPRDVFNSLFSPSACKLATRFTNSLRCYSDENV